MRVGWIAILLAAVAPGCRQDAAPASAQGDTGVQPADVAASEPPRDAVVADTAHPGPGRPDAAPPDARVADAAPPDAREADAALPDARVAAAAAPADARVADAAVPEPFVDSDDAQELFGLKVGARWTYLRSGDELRWKMITACEEVLLLDIETGERRVQRAYVRENRGRFGVTSVHYLVVNETGVHRIRLDDVDSGGLRMFTTYEPTGPRLLNGPYPPGELRGFAQRTAEWDPIRWELRGESSLTAVDTVLEASVHVMVAGTFEALGIERQWDAINPHNVQSFYAAGAGEVLEITTWPEVPLPRIQVEELVEFTPGQGRCEAAPDAAEEPCVEPLRRCDDAWGTGAPGCTDPRVDARNCGGCDTICPSGVCAGGFCVESACDLACAGTTVCCPSAWNWQSPGCTSPSRDRWNCGGCGLECGVNEICDQGECACGPGTGDCGQGGCQDLLFDGANCGVCGRACGGDRPVCDKGICVASCLSVDLAECGNDCVDLNWSPDHCGACDNACGKGTGTDSCVAGVCVPCAQAGLTDCDADCVDLNWSDKNCGACGRECGDQEVCVQGGCVGGDGSCPAACDDGDRICCGGECVDPRVSDSNCGGCGVDRCAGGCNEGCQNGLCVPVDCGGGSD